ncbi:MAG: ATP-binding cassette domain-containing protein, partial [Planctomycetales bacterium]|nr:ATP-binding cassette domain-containing protein [Planctomycetales bacterium]
MNESAVIRVENLSKTYQQGWLRPRDIEALRGVSLEVKAGEVFGLLGPNGAGKTTFIKILLGIIRKSGGAAALVGHPAGDPRGRKKIGYVPERLQ